MAMPKICPGLMIAAPRSGSGKTTLTLGLLRAFRRAGVAAGSAKCGPDYIDPPFHLAAAGGPASIWIPGRCRRRCSGIWPPRPESAAT